MLLVLILCVLSIARSDCGDDYVTNFPVDLIGTQIFGLQDQGVGLSIEECARRCCMCVVASHRRYKRLLLCVFVTQTYQHFTRAASILVTYFLFAQLQVSLAAAMVTRRCA